MVHFEPRHVLLDFPSTVGLPDYLKFSVVETCAFTTCVLYFFQVTFQYSFWDKLKVVGDLASHSVDNLSCLMSHLIARRALSLAILKVLRV